MRHRVVGARHDNAIGAHQRVGNPARKVGGSKLVGVPKPGPPKRRHREEQHQSHSQQHEPGATVQRERA